MSKVIFVITFLVWLSGAFYSAMILENYPKAIFELLISYAMYYLAFNDNHNDHPNTD